MKKNCNREWVYGFLCVLWSIFFTSCSTIEADGETVLKPDTSRMIVHKLYPNDLAKNDSAAANISRGIMLVVHPGASYKLSFDKDPNQPAPELQLFRPYSIQSGLFGLSKVRALSPTVVGNRYVYSFNCEENEMTVWYTSLGVDGQYYKGEVGNISYTGTGSNDDHFSINLIVVGAMEKTKDGFGVDELAKLMLSTFREKYYGMTIDSLYVRYAHEHPTLGSKYPANYPWVAGVNSEDTFLSELAASVDDSPRNALNVFLVHSISGVNIMGLSRLFAGVLGADSNNAVVVGEHVRKQKGEIELLPSNNIVMTTVHETGHFFGLRHTSTTGLDLKQYAGGDEKTGIMVGDWSNIEDGMTDTPFCEYILRSGLYKQGDVENDYGIYTDIRALEYAKTLSNLEILNCPDLYNIMFPVTVDDNKDVSFSKQQLELVRSTLMIIPH